MLVACTAVSLRSFFVLNTTCIAAIRLRFNSTGGEQNKLLATLHTYNTIVLVIQEGTYLLCVHVYATVIQLNYNKTKHRYTTHKYFGFMLAIYVHMCSVHVLVKLVVSHVWCI